jgi:hypothetical protein
VERLSREEGISFNQFVTIAVAEKVSARLFSDRKARADFASFDKIMRRREAPREGDEMPSRVRHKE